MNPRIHSWFGVVKFFFLPDHVLYSPSSPFLFSTQLLVGEEMDITSKALSTEDMDTPADKLVYNIEATKNGLVALKESPDIGVERFTQAQIDSGEVIFIHKGSPLQMSLCLLGDTMDTKEDLENKIKLILPLV